MSAADEGPYTGGRGEGAGRDFTVRIASIGEVAYWLAFPLILVYALAIAVPSPYVNDGFVYLTMVEGLAEHGSLAFENEWTRYRSPAQLLNFFLPVGDPGGERLVAQYPSGWAFLAAPFWLAGGVRGIFLMNALLILLTLWLVRLTARLLSGDERVALTAALIWVYATYAFDYAGAIWPHAPTLAVIAGATAMAVLARQRDDLRWALGAGLAVGIGVHFRVDAILVAPPLMLWLLGTAARPYRTLGAFAAGMVPGLALAVAINWAKFGIASPLSYGRDEQDGGTTLATWAPPLSALAAGGAAALLLGLAPVRRAVYRPRALLGFGAAGLAAVALVPPLRELAVRTLLGGAGLVIDMQLFHDWIGQGGLEQASDGTWRAYRLAKKALLQSLPYAAALPLIAPLLVRPGKDRAAVALLVLVALAILAPFAMIGWWGGKANHMRYLLHLTPALAILAALTLRRIGELPQGREGVLWAAAYAVPLVGLVYGLARRHDLIYVLQNSVPNAVTLTIALALLAWWLTGRAAAAAALRGATWAGVVLAGLSAWGLDLVIHQGDRNRAQVLTEAVRALPDDIVLQVIYPNWAFERIGVAGTLLIDSPGEGRYYDADLLRRLLAEQRPVYVQHRYIAELMVEDGVAGRAELVVDTDPWFQLFRVYPPS